MLDALRGGPKHGYEIIRCIEERSSGQYAPSPGTVYPTLQYLEELGQVSCRADADRKVYQITEAGLQELEAHREELQAFWARFRPPDLSPSCRREVEFLHEEMGELKRAAWSALWLAVRADDPDILREVRLALESCKNQVRHLCREGRPPDKT